MKKIYKVQDFLIHSWLFVSVFLMPWIGTGDTKTDKVSMPVFYQYFTESFSGSQKNQMYRLQENSQNIIMQNWQMYIFLLVVISYLVIEVLEIVWIIKKKDMLGMAFASVPLLLFTTCMACEWATMADRHFFITGFGVAGWLIPYAYLWVLLYLTNKNEYGEKS